jgi:hypothetical protein
VPALRGPHVPGQRQRGEEAALADHAQPGVPR